MYVLRHLFSMCSSVTVNLIIYDITERANRFAWAIAGQCLHLNRIVMIEVTATKDTVMLPQIMGEYRRYVASWWPIWDPELPIATR
jgi:hypothetical protein